MGWEGQLCGEEQRGISSEGHGKASGEIKFIGFLRTKLRSLKSRGPVMAQSDRTAGRAFALHMPTGVPEPARSDSSVKTWV